MTALSVSATFSRSTPPPRTSLGRLAFCPGVLVQISRKQFVLGATVMVLVFGGGSFAVAATESDAIQGCYSDTNGQLRVLTSGQCKSSEIAIEWNKQGPIGDTGATGPQGPTGEDWRPPVLLGRTGPP